MIVSAAWKFHAAAARSTRKGFRGVDPGVELRGRFGSQTAWCRNRDLLGFANLRFASGDLDSCQSLLYSR